jgi:predicted pyridoxine 5'-phosphate oxidase superfamily flavin-nucleotide-binding protein
MLLDDAVRAFLQQRLIARMTTLGPDGYPHTVPVWYMLDGDDILIATGHTTRKIRNIRANPRGALVMGGDPLDENRTYQPCYLFQGKFSLEGESGFDLITRIAYRYRDDHDQADHDIAEWGPHQPIRFTIKTVIRVME